MSDKTRTFYGTIGRFIINRVERQLGDLAVRHNVNLETERTPKGLMNVRLRVSVAGEHDAVDLFMTAAESKWG